MTMSTTPPIRITSAASAPIETRAASFEMAGGLGPDYFPQPAASAAATPKAQVVDELLGLQSQFVHAGVEITPEQTKTVADGLAALWEPASALKPFPTVDPDVVTNGLGATIKALNELHAGPTLDTGRVLGGFAQALDGLMHVQ